MSLLLFQDENIDFYLCFLDVPNNAEPGYTAEIKLVDGITYDAVLMIKSVPEDIDSKTIYLTVKENMGSSETDSPRESST